MLLKRNELSAVKRRKALTNERLGPFQFVSFNLAFGQAFVQQGARSLLNRSEIAGPDEGVKAGFKFGSKGDRHDQL